jgi:adenylate kinase
MRLYFVGGIHGSGKTTLCKRLAVILGAAHYSAGELIRLGSKHQDDRSKAVQDVELNQRLLLEVLDELSGRAATVLLDGHYTLIDQQGLIRPIGIDVFRALNPAVLLLVAEEPITISHRLQQRDGKTYDLPFLELHSKGELAHAELLSAQLSIPLAVLNSSDSADDAAELLTAADARSLR